jgi:hypothetical protein
MGLFSKIFKGLKSAVKKVVKGVKKVVKKVKNNKLLGLVAGVALGVAMPGLLPSIGGWLTSLPVVGPAFSAIGTGVNAIGQAVMGGIKTAYGATEPFRGWFSNTFPKLSNTFRSVSDTVMEGVNWVTNRIKGLNEIDTSGVRRMTLEGDIVSASTPDGLVGITTRTAGDPSFGTSRLSATGDVVTPEMLTGVDVSNVRRLSETGELITSQPSISERLTSMVDDKLNEQITNGMNDITNTAMTRVLGGEEYEAANLEDFEPSYGVAFSPTSRQAFGQQFSTEFLQNSPQVLRQEIPYIPDNSYAAGYEEFMSRLSTNQQFQVA